MIIRLGNKGGGVVILEKSFYHSQLSDMLSDGDTYLQLDKDPTNNYRIDCNNLVDYGYYIRVLTKKEKMYLSPSFNLIPTIYSIPKIYKDPVNPPARLIVNGIDSVTSRVGQYLYHFLQMSVVHAKAYLKDTTNFLQLLKGVVFSVNAESYLVSADVSSLYTIIQHDNALVALN